MVISALLFVGGGFLVAVLWFDLMFDVQVLGATPGIAALGSVAAYYRRVTTEAAPMGHLVAAVMVTTLVASLADVARARERRSLRVLAFLLIAAPITLASVRVFPNAVTLGREALEDVAQLSLARAILRDHLLCLASIVGFLAVRLRIAVGARG
jgi:hypothetical protein